MSRLLGGFESILLFAVLELDGVAHSVRIRRTIEERTGRVVSPGAIHTALDRLEKRELVSSKTGASSPKHGGRPRRFYSLTAGGAAALHESHGAIRQMADGLEKQLAKAASAPSGGEG